MLTSVCEVFMLYLYNSIVKSPMCSHIIISVGEGPFLSKYIELHVPVKQN